MSDLSPRRRQLILVICCLSLFIAGVDVTIVNVALPSIQRSLPASVTGLQWAIDAYTLVIASLLMLSGSLADRFGRRRVFQAGLAAFSLGSLLCSISPGLGWLIAFRGLQAVGGSMLNPVAMSITVTTFTDRRERARAVGIWGSVLGLSLVAGPVLGGPLVSGIGWRAIFWINVPIGIVLGALAGAALVVAESRRRDPLIDVRFFRSAPFSGASAIALAAFATLGGFLFLNTLYLQDVRGFSALSAGLLTISMAAALAVFARVSGRLVGSRGPRLPLTLAGLALAAGSLLLTRLTPDTPVGFLMVAYVIFGAGSGLVTAPITSTAVSGMPAAQAGVAGAVASTSRQLGAAASVGAWHRQAQRRTAGPPIRGGSHDRGVPAAH